VVKNVGKWCKCVEAKRCKCVEAKRCM